MARTPPPTTLDRLVAYVRANPGATARRAAAALGQPGPAIEHWVQLAVGAGLVRRTSGLHNAVRLYATCVDRGEPTTCPPCDACGRSWVGGTVHCGGLDGCHRLFSTFVAYRQHQQNGLCVAPGKVGLCQANQYGQRVWRRREELH